MVTTANIDQKARSAFGIQRGDIVISNDDETVIMCTEDTEEWDGIFKGVVIHGDREGVYTIGEYDSAWDVSCFEKFYGTISLTSE